MYLACLNLTALPRVCVTKPCLEIYVYLAVVYNSLNTRTCFCCRFILVVDRGDFTVYHCV